VHELAAKRRKKRKRSIRPRQVLQEEAEGMEAFNMGWDRASFDQAYQ
jgi:hypothetical protein